MGLYEGLEKLIEENNIRSFVISQDVVAEMTELKDFYPTKYRKEGSVELIGNYKNIPVMFTDEITSEVCAICKDEEQVNGKED